jgi:hypothetical protein
LPLLPPPSLMSLAFGGRGRPSEQVACAVAGIHGAIAVPEKELAIIPTGSVGLDCTSCLPAKQTTAPGFDVRFSMFVPSLSCHMVPDSHDAFDQSTRRRV